MIYGSGALHPYMGDLGLGNGNVIERHIRNFKLLIPFESPLLFFSFRQNFYSIVRWFQFQLFFRIRSQLLFHIPEFYRKLFFSHFGKLCRIQHQIVVNLLKILQSVRITLQIHPRLGRFMEHCIQQLFISLRNRHLPFLQNILFRHIFFIIGATAYFHYRNTAK